MTRVRELRESLRSRISDEEWALHTRIPGETALADEYGVSRGTVREAIRGLAELGLVEAAPGRGTFVRSRVPSDRVLRLLLQSAEPAECLELRAAIEGEAARTIASRPECTHFERLEAVARTDGHRQRLPGEFHSRLVEAGGKPLNRSLHAAALSAISEFLMRGTIAHALDDTDRERDHLAIIAAIRRGDSALAGALAAEHARNDFRYDPGAQPR